MLEWAIWKKGILDVLVRLVMSVCDGAKTRVRVDCELSEKIDVNVVVVVNFIKHQNRAITGERVAARAAPSYQYAMVLVMYQGSMLSPFIFVFVVDVITEMARIGVLNELRYADDLV